MNFIYSLQIKILFETFGFPNYSMHLNLDLEGMQPLPKCNTCIVSDFAEF